MRIALYGMPCSGKTYILDRINFMEVIEGSKQLLKLTPDFDRQNAQERRRTRKEMAQILFSKEEFIMDGHYAFGDEIAFTEEDGNLYEAFLYLYINPDVLKSRMEISPKNRKFLEFNIVEWQQKEIRALREYCHVHNKDFYVIDNPIGDIFEDISSVIDFIRAVHDGYSCVKYARACADSIINECDADTIVLLDGDKTLTVTDTSNAVLGYTTHLFDGNFYTGYQTWIQQNEFSNYCCPQLTAIPVDIRVSVMSKLKTPAYILTSGHEDIWRYISTQLKIPFFGGFKMSAETKLYITKFLQEAGKKIIAYGDSMNDYFMLKQADEGYLVRKTNGTISRSLSGQDLEGLRFV